MTDGTKGQTRKEARAANAKWERDPKAREVDPANNDTDPIPESDTEDDAVEGDGQ